MMRQGPKVRRPVSPLQLLILLQLTREPKYGYEMLKSLRDDFEGVWDLKTGSFYPALRSLESRAFIESKTKEDTDFFSLTQKWEGLLVRMAERFEEEYKFADRYFKIVMKLMHPSMRERVMKIVRSLSMEDIQVDMYSNMQQFLKEADDRKSALEALDVLRKMLRTRLDTVDRLYEEYSNGENSP
jgi:DNA-binding PadR family transcriptional regulator